MFRHQMVNHRPLRGGIYKGTSKLFHHQSLRHTLALNHMKGLTFEKSSCQVLPDMYISLAYRVSDGNACCLEKRWFWVCVCLFAIYTKYLPITVLTVSHWSMQSLHRLTRFQPFVLCPVTTQLPTAVNWDLFVNVHGVSQVYSFLCCCGQADTVKLSWARYNLIVLSAWELLHAQFHTCAVNTDMSVRTHFFAAARSLRADDDICVIHTVRRPYARPCKNA